MYEKLAFLMYYSIIGSKSNYWYCCEFCSDGGGLAVGGGSVCIECGGVKNGGGFLRSYDDLTP